MTPAEVRAAILQETDQAKAVAVKAWFKLHDTKLHADVEKLFTVGFGVVSTSRSKASGTTMHRIVVARYEGALRKVSDDDVHVSCRGWPWGGFTDDRPDTYFTNNVPGRLRFARGARSDATARERRSKQAAPLPN